jgi:NADH-quinone oxidoreductase subunit M
MARAAFSLLLACLLLLVPGWAAAEPALVVKPLGGPAPVRLTAEPGAYAGAFTVENRGSEPLQIRSVAPRPGAGLVPRLPPTVTAQFDDGRTQATLEPGVLRQVDVRWAFRRDRGPTEILGQIVVETEDGQSAAIGIRAERSRGFVRAHALSLLLLLPLLGLIALAAFARRRSGRVLGAVPLVVAVAQLALAVWICGRFDVELTRYHGGDGFQFVEAARLLPSLGIQLWLGIDGISIGFIVLVPLVLAVASLGARSLERPGAFWAWVLALETGLLGMLVSLDLVLWLAAWLLTAISAVFLVGGWSSGRRHGMRLAAHFAVAGMLIALAFLHLSSHAGPGYLIDGSVAPRVFGFSELAQAEFLARGALEPGAAKLVWASLFMGFWILIAAVPFHGWLVSALRSAPAPVGILLVGGLVPTAVYGLVRFGYGLVPEGMHWAATSVAALGVVGALWAALAALAERDLSRFAAYASATYAGLALFALGGLTGIGVQAALTQAIGHGLAGAALLVAVGVLRDRTRTANRALAAAMPGFGLLAGIAFLGSMALPGTLTFIGAIMGLVGAFPMHPALALLALLVIALSATAHLAGYSRAFGLRAAAQQASPAGLERREITALALCALLLISLGFWPRALLRLSDASALDQAERVRPPGPTQIATSPPAPPALALLGVRD